MRYAPRIAICVLGLTSLILAWELTGPQSARGPRPLDAASLAALQAEAFTQAEAQPGFNRPEQVAARIAPGETFQQALTRLGVAPAEAQQAVHALSSAFDIIHIRAGLAFEAALARPRDRRGPVRLIGLSMRTGPATAITLSRTFDGALRLREMEEKVRAETTVAKGKMSDSLYVSALQAGATPELTAQVVKIFSHKLDFSRDIHPGDPFSLVFNRQVTESGRTVQAGDLLYAEIGAKGETTRFYRFQPAGSSQAEYFDEFGKNIRGFLLQTPLDGARISSGFGLRLHPILGYTRMHTGIDFAAPTGTPVFAAGDGVVQQASWKGGYGRWLEIRHTGQWSTGYGHLSGWTVRAGQHVHQGQVVGYVGASGLATGPHLHYEVMLKGQKINPKGAKVPQGEVLEGRELVAFRAEMAHIDALVGGAAPQADPIRLAQAEPTPVLRGEYGGAARVGGR
jgi:murein DD-endopeptidase MepM/ murein hydrolase activator NlpD